MRERQTVIKKKREKIYKTNPVQKMEHITFTDIEQKPSEGLRER